MSNDTLEPHAYMNPKQVDIIRLIMVLVLQELGVIAVLICKFIKFLLFQMFWNVLQLVSVVLF